MVRDSINLMVKDLIKNSLINFKLNKINKLYDVYKSENKLVYFSSNYENTINEIRDFLSFKMYKNNKVLKKNNEGRRIIEKLFKEISSKPRKFLTFTPIKHNKYRSVADYISGMTDRFAINIYKSLK
jgi:dGTP triphosphohydrolase